MKRLPLGIKILVIIFVLESVGYLLSLRTVIKFGFLVLFLRLIISVLFLCAAIGLFKLKRWARRYSIVCFVIEGLSGGISFTKSFILSFKEGFKKSSGIQIENSVALNTLAITLAILIVGIVIYFLVKYLYQEKMKDLFS